MVQSTTAFARWSYLVAYAALFIGISAAAQAQTGEITGTIVDKSNGEPIAGATLKVEGTKRGAYSDVRGRFTVKKMPAGVYTVTARALGFNNIKIEQVEVKPGETAKLNLQVESKAVVGEEVVVFASAIKGGDASLLKDRQKSVAVSDAIGSESISRLAGASVADVAQRITGVSVVDGKYLTVRGLGDRYMNYQLNGAQMASSDPDRNDVSMDQFSSSFIESIVTSKSFTPDQPGSFTGGAVNVKTKAFPSERSVSSSIRVGYNTIGSLRSDFTQATTSPTDWLGMDDGTRAVPNYVQELGPGGIPSLGEARTDPEAAVVLDNASKSFSNRMAPSAGNSGLPARINLSYADLFDVGEVPFGIVTSLQYAQNFEAYTNGQFAQWQLTGKADEKESLETQSFLEDRRGVATTFWGAMFNLNAKPTPNHQLGVNFMHNQRAENEGRYLVGSLARDLPPNFSFETRTQRFIERGNTSVQLLGESFFQDLGSSKLIWNLSYNRSTPEEPDIRFFSNEFVSDGDSNLYFIDAANYALPQHFYRNMVENRYWADFSVKTPFLSWTGTNGNFKVGGAFDFKDRIFTEARYEYRQQDAQYAGDVDEFFSTENKGIVDTTSRGGPVFGNYIVDVSQDVNNYDGAQTIAAGFAMVELPVTSEFRVITGVRLETTDLRVDSRDSSASQGSVVETNFLPSLAAIYALTERQNLRVSYGRTLARPTFRELAPFSSFDFVGGFIINGNPNLQQTNVDNFDLRWEWFLRPTDIVAVSAFYKEFDNPIEQAIVSANNQIQFQNVPEATVFGMEFEARSALDFIADPLANFYFGGNLTLTESEVDIPPKELEALLELYGEDAPTKRQLQGQSPFLFNIQLGYLNLESGTDINITVNTFGDRLSRVSIGGTPNVFEKGRTRIDLVASQRLVGNLSVKVQALNLLNPPIREFHTFKGVEYDMVRNLNGRMFTLSFAYKF